MFFERVEEELEKVGVLDFLAQRVFRFLCKPLIVKV
jgi:hypothetical protein